MAEDIVARYVLEVNDLKSQVKVLEGEFNKLTDAEKKSAKAGEDAFNKTKDAAEKTDPVVKAFNEKINQLGKAIVAAFAVEQVISFGKECVKAFSEAEANALKLKTAVSVNGGLNQDFEKLLLQSEKLQKQSIFSDDQIQGLQTAALQFGLTSNEVEKLTPLIIDFASATGQDLQSAFGAIVQGTNGATRGLRQYGITLEEGQSKQQNYLQIVDQLNAKFKGQGEAISETTGGALVKLANAWDNLKESVGGALAPIVTSIADFASNTLNAATESDLLSKKIEDERNALNVLVMQIESTNVGTKRRSDLIKELNEKYPSFLKNLDSEKVTNEQLSNRLKEVNAEYVRKALLTSKQEEVDAKGKAVGEAYNKVYDAQKEIFSIANQKGLQNYIDLKANVYDQATQVIKALENENDQIRSGAIATTNSNAAIVANNKLINQLYEYRNKGNEATKEYNQLNQELTDVLSELTDYQKKFGDTTKKTNEEISLSNTDFSKLKTDQLKQLAKDGNQFAIDELQRRKEADKKTKDEQQKAFEELKKVADAYNEKVLEDAAKNEEEKLKLQKDAALKQAKEIFEKAGGVKNTKAEEEYLIAVRAINADFDKKIADAKIKSINDYYSEVIKKAEEGGKNELQITLNNIDATTSQKIVAAKESYNKIGDFSKEAEKKLQDDIKKIQADAENEKAAIILQNKKNLADDELALEIDKQKKILAAAGGTSDAQKAYDKAVTDATKKNNDEKALADSEFNKTVQKNAETTATVQTDQSNKAKDTWIERNQEMIDKSVELANTVFDLINQGIESDIANKEEELQRIQDQFDAEQQLNQQNFDNRLIGAAEFERRKKEIDAQRIASEKKVQEEINKLKRQEDANKRTQAIFQIALSTAQAIISALSLTPPNVPLSIIVGAIGAAQLAAVLAQPVPKYAKGTKWLERGKNPYGVDTIPIMADEGERIIPRKKNMEYWDIYEAIDSGKFNDYMDKKFIVPALNKQRNEFKRSETNNYATAIANRLSIDSDRLASKIGAELEWRNRNGIEVKGMNILVEKLSEKIDKRKL